MMPQIDLSEWSGLPRQSERYSHGQHLVPKDANEDRSRRRRRKYCSNDKERRQDSCDRGYRSDNEPRRRHEDSKERCNARPAQRSHSKACGEHRIDDSDSDNDDDNNNNDNDNDDNNDDANDDDGDHRPRKGCHSRTKGVGDHRLDGSDNKPYRPRRSPSVPKQYSERFIDDFMPENSIEHPNRYSRHYLYGEHQSDNHAKMPPLLIPHEQPTLYLRRYGEHQIDTPVNMPSPPDKTVINPSGVKLPPDDHTLGEHHLAGSNLHMASSPVVTTLRQSYYAENTDHSFVPSSPGGNERHTRRRPRSNTFSGGDQSQGKYYDPLATNSVKRLNSAESFPDTRLPHTRISQYTSDFPHSWSNTASPGDSKSEAGSYIERPGSGLATSTNSTALLSSVALPLSSGVLERKPHRYMPLKNILDFRLIRILPETMSGLKCEILHSSLDHAPDYIAISVKSPYN